jgi:hypothetical protein
MSAHALKVIDSECPASLIASPYSASFPPRRDEVGHFALRQTNRFADVAFQ